MPVPTAYTEAELAQFMIDILGNTAGVIGWTVASPAVAEAITETLVAYGVADIALASDMKKLRVITRREVWRAVMDETAGNYRFGSDREAYFRNQVYEHAAAQYARYAAEAAPFVTDDDSVRVSVYDAEYAGDPYVWIADEDVVGVE